MTNCRIDIKIFSTVLACISTLTPACGQSNTENPPRTAPAAGTSSVNLGSAQIKLAFDRNTGRISILNWSDLVVPTIRVDFADSADEKSSQGLVKYCEVLGAIAKKVDSMSSPNTSRTTQAIRTQDRLKLSFRILQPQLAGPKLGSDIATELRKQGVPIGAENTVDIENTISIGRVDVKFEITRDGIVSREAAANADINLGKLLNESTTQLSRGETVVLPGIGDSVACDLANGNATLTVAPQGRYPDKETRTARLSARNVSQLLEYVESSGTGTAQTDSYTPIRRTITLADAYQRLKLDSIAKFGTENFVSLYRSFYEPDTILGFNSAVQRYGRAQAIARSLDSVSSVARPFAFEAKKVKIEGGAK